MAKQSHEMKPLTKAEKAAVLLLCLDQDTTGDIFNQMQDDEIRKIGTALIQMKKISAEEINKILAEFSQEIKIAKPLDQKNIDVDIDGGRAAENLLTKSLAGTRGRTLLTSLKQPESVQVGSEDDVAELLQKCGDDELFSLLQNEHPQVMAIGLAHLKKKQARIFLDKVPEDIQVDIISRMARLEKVPARVLGDFKSYIIQKLAELRKKKESSDEPVTTDLAVEGLGEAVKLLKSFARDRSGKLVEQIEKMDQEIGAVISKQMFTIEDLEKANDVSIRELLRSVSNEDLKVALKNTPDNLKNRFFKNMSERAAMILKEDMEVLPPLKVEEIDVAQSNIIKVAKEMLKEGKLVLEETVVEEE